ncbi:hypothetical protein HRbin16_01624 [bacterium HR16]|nr:hypothetical protein HRbin16_01624 [bacterium HR16]
MERNSKTTIKTPRDEPRQQQEQAEYVAHHRIKQAYSYGLANWDVLSGKGKHNPQPTALIGLMRQLSDHALRLRGLRWEAWTMCG